jgi:hypothetical protein
MEFENAFWNMLKKELPKYKDCLDIIFLHHLFEIVNVNTAFEHVFNHLQNCPINITFVVDPKSLPNLGVPMGGNKV